MAEDAYAEALQSLFEGRRGGIAFGLERIERCLAALGLEHRQTATVQVAGTNGKGSTSAFLESILRRAGYRVGVFSSPHLLSICERFRIDGKDVTRERFVEAFEAVAVHGGTLTFFERITAMAAWLFDREGVDVAIYEVGLGGRLDSTTAIPANVSIVTGIGLDHCEFLGDSLESIAREKAGIFRPGIPAVIGLAAEGQIRTLLAELADVSVMVGDEHLARVPERLPLRGAHQRGNAACAVAAALVLRGQGLSIDDAALDEGLACARIRGRLEEIVPGFLIDAAHNPQAAVALAVALAESEFESLTLVVGLSRNKDIKGFLTPLRPYCQRLVVTQATSERAIPATEIASVADALGYLTVEIEPDVPTAIGIAQRGRATVLATGSLIVLGEVLSALGVSGADPQLVTDPGERAK